MGASSSTACSSTACRSGPREPAQEMGRRLALFHRQGNHPEDGFHAAGDISARPPAIAQCHLDLVHHPAGVGLRVGVAPPVPWPSPPTWPRKIFLVADGAFFSAAWRSSWRCVKKVRCGPQCRSATRSSQKPCVGRALLFVRSSWLPSHQTLRQALDRNNTAWICGDEVEYPPTRGMLE